MKKTIITTALLALTANAFSSDFTGAYVGLGLGGHFNSLKAKENKETKQLTIAGETIEEANQLNNPNTFAGSLLAGYGFDFGNNLVGSVQLEFNKSFGGKTKKEEAKKETQTIQTIETTQPNTITTDTSDTEQEVADLEAQAKELETNVEIKKLKAELAKLQAEVAGSQYEKMAKELADIADGLEKENKVVNKEEHDISEESLKEFETAADNFEKAGEEHEQAQEDLEAAQEDFENLKTDLDEARNQKQIAEQEQARKADIAFNKSNANKQNKLITVIKTKKEVTLKENYSFGISYLQGYQLDNFLPYVKAGLSFTSFTKEVKQANEDAVTKTSVSSLGLDLGLGARIAINDNFKVGAEYTATYLFNGKDGIKGFNRHNLGLNAVYSF